MPFQLNDIEKKKDLLPMKKTNPVPKQFALSRNTGAMCL